jgi:hypothetical protein
MDLNTNQRFIIVKIQRDPFHLFYQRFDARSGLYQETDKANLACRFFSLRGAHAIHARLALDPLTWGICDMAVFQAPLWTG